MADALAGETKTSLDVFEFKIGMFPDDLVRTHAVGKQLQNITHSHPHAADAGTPAALLRIHRDSFKDLHHKLTSRTENISQVETAGYGALLCRGSCLWQRSAIKDPIN